MSAFRRLALWWRALTRRAAVDAEMAREMAVHVAMEEAHLLATGVAADEAHRRARIAFGAVEVHKDAVRDERGTRWLEIVAQDVKVAVRGLRKRPGFTFGVVLTLALGVGPTTAVFAWANWILFRPVPGVSHPEQIVPIAFAEDEGRGSSYGLSYRGLDILRESTPAFEHIAAYARNIVQTRGLAGPPRDIHAVYVAGDYFGALGVQAASGRTFAPAELARSGDGHEVVISDALWRREYNGTPSIIGSTANFSGVDFTVIGVLKPEFRGTEQVGTADVWFPPAAIPALKRQPVERIFDVGEPMLDRLIVRVDAHRSSEQVLAAVRQGTIRIDAAIGDTTYREYLAYKDGNLGNSLWAEQKATSTIRLLLGVAALILLVAGANTANIILLRAHGRRPEFTMRRALGATGRRLLVLHGTEGCILALVGTFAGMGIALGLARMFAGGVSYRYPIYAHLPIDRRVVAVVSALFVGAALLFTVAPLDVIFRALRIAPAQRQNQHTVPRARSVLTVIQIAASMSLVVCALLLIGTIRNLRRVPTGMDLRAVTSVTLNTFDRGYDATQLHSLRGTLLRELARRAGVVAAAIGTNTQFSGSTFGESLRPVGYPGKDWPVHPISYSVSAGYFRTMGIELLAGRTFRPDEVDDSTAHVVILGQLAARQLFGNANPIGRVVEEGSSPIRQLTVIGIVSDTRVATLRGAPSPTMYTTRPDPWGIQVAVAVRSSLPPSTVAAYVRDAADKFDPTLPVATLQPMDEMVTATMSQELLFAKLLTILAGTAITLSSFGLYSIVAQGVAERRREIGVRMALGAYSRQVVALVVGGGLRLAIVGVLLGVGGAYALSRTIRALLFGVAASDPATYIGAAATAILVAAAACAAPAITASRVDPVETLRAE